MSALSDRIAEANKDRLSSRAIAEKASALGVNVSHTAISLVLNGKHGNIKPPTIRALNRVFKVPMPELHELVKLGPDHEPWEPPEIAARMSPKQRRLVESLIHELVRPEDSEPTPSHQTDVDRGKVRKAPDPKPHR